MRLHLATVLALAPMATAAAASECLVPGKMPLRIHFADGSVEQGFSVTDGVLRSNFLNADGGIDVNEMKFGFYRLSQISGTDVTRWDWGDQTLIPVQELPVGEDKVFDPVTIDGNVAIRVTITSKGGEEVTVGGCTYPVIHLTGRYDFPDGGGAIVSDQWIEPTSMLMLKSEKDRLDQTGAVTDHGGRMADEITLRPA